MTPLQLPELLFTLHIHGTNFIDLPGVACSGKTGALTPSRAIATPGRYTLKVANADALVIPLSLVVGRENRSTQHTA